jgi:hypothetical protein
VASAYDVNSGRVAEAIIAIEYAIDNTPEIYKLAMAKKDYDTATEASG